MTPTRSEIDRALKTVIDRSIAAQDWHACHAIAHFESELFGFDPDCPEGCPLA